MVFLYRCMKRTTTRKIFQAGKFLFFRCDHMTISCQFNQKHCMGSSIYLGIGNNLFENYDSWNQTKKTDKGIREDTTMKRNLLQRISYRGVTFSRLWKMLLLFSYAPTQTLTLKLSVIKPEPKCYSRNQWWQNKMTIGSIVLLQ